jgi:hypothetical protein
MTDERTMEDGAVLHERSRHTHYTKKEGYVERVIRDTIVREKKGLSALEA